MKKKLALASLLVIVSFFAGYGASHYSRIPEGKVVACWFVSDHKYRELSIHDLEGANDIVEVWAKKKKLDTNSFIAVLPHNNNGFTIKWKGISQKDLMEVQELIIDYLGDNAAMRKAEQNAATNN